MHHLYQLRPGSAFGLLSIFLVIAASSVELLLAAMSYIEPEPIVTEIVALIRNTTL